MLDENEFLGPYGIRALSRFHQDHPFVFHTGGQEYRVNYLPGESDTGMFGGNSNWRGPVWMPVNVLIIRALLNLYGFYGDDFKVQCPTGSGRYMTLFEVAQDLARRLAGYVPARRQRTAASLWRYREVPERSALARPDPLLRILPRRQRSRAWRQPPDRVDRFDRRDSRPVWPCGSQGSGVGPRPTHVTAREGAGRRVRRVIPGRRGVPGDACVALRVDPLRPALRGQEPRLKRRWYR